VLFCTFEIQYKELDENILCVYVSIHLIAIFRK